MTSWAVANMPGVDFKILGSDISTKVLQKAIDGVYPIKDLEDIPPKFRQGQFLTKSAETFEMSADLKRMLSFGRVNLSMPPFPMKGPFDVIFCRNVMIYFDQAVRSRLVNEMYRLLKPGGYLMIAHSETLTGISVPLRPVRPSVYFKEGK
jgi:chemotaxis protein methyltransferase CheR